MYGPDDGSLFSASLFVDLHLWTPSCPESTCRTRPCGGASMLTVPSFGKSSPSAGSCALNSPKLAGQGKPIDSWSHHVCCDTGFGKDRTLCIQRTRSQRSICLLPVYTLGIVPTGYSSMAPVCSMFPAGLHPWTVTEEES